MQIYIIFTLLILIPLPSLSAQPKGCAKWSLSKVQSHYLTIKNDVERETVGSSISPELVTAIIVSESCFKERVVSPKGAVGLMQLMPDTAIRFGVSDRYKGTQNIKGGVKYLKFLSKKFNHDLTKIIASYNAGEGAVDRYKGVPPYAETKQYLINVLHVYRQLKGTKKEELTHFQSTEKMGLVNTKAVFQNGFLRWKVSPMKRAFDGFKTERKEHYE